MSAYTYPGTRIERGVTTRPVWPWEPDGARVRVGNVLHLTTPVRATDRDDAPTTPKRRTTTSTVPESPGQARLWETVKNKYLSAGLCVRCASQAAWGHQLGFTALEPACTVCATVSLPTTGWFVGHAERARRWLPAGTAQPLPRGWFGAAGPRVPAALPVTGTDQTAALAGATPEDAQERPPVGLQGACEVRRVSADHHGFVRTPEAFRRSGSEPAPASDAA